MRIPKLFINDSRLLLILLVSVVLHLLFLSQMEWNEPSLSPLKTSRFEVDLVPVRDQKKSSTFRSQQNPPSVPRSESSNEQVPATRRPLLKPVKPTPLTSAELAENIPSMAGDGKRELADSHSYLSTAEPQISLSESGQRPAHQETGIQSGQIAVKQHPIQIESIGVGKSDTDYAIRQSQGERAQKVFAPSKGSTGEDGIEGEVGKRKVIYKPKPPRLDIERDITITLRFSVLPNGEVDKIFPYRKGDAQLERLAIKMLQQYRFEPISGLKTSQTGIIHFKIRRRSN